MPKYTQDGTSKNLLEPYGPNKGEIKGGDITVLSFKGACKILCFYTMCATESAVFVQRL